MVLHDCSLLSVPHLLDTVPALQVPRCDMCVTRLALFFLPAGASRRRKWAGPVRL